MGTESIEKVSSDDNFLHKQKFDSKCYEVGLPWIGDHIKLSDDREPCINRLKLLHKRLYKNPEILCEYDHVIQLEKNILKGSPFAKMMRRKGPFIFICYTIQLYEEVEALLRSV